MKIKIKVNDKDWFTIIEILKRIVVNIDSFKSIQNVLLYEFTKKYSQKLAFKVPENKVKTYSLSLLEANFLLVIFQVFPATNIDHVITDLIFQIDQQLTSLKVESDSFLNSLKTASYGNKEIAQRDYKQLQ